MTVNPMLRRTACTRSDTLNEAIATFLDLQRIYIEEGLRSADADEFARGERMARVALRAAAKRS